MVSLRKRFGGKMRCPVCNWRLILPPGQSPYKRMYQCRNRQCDIGVMKIVVFSRKIEGEIRPL